MLHKINELRMHVIPSVKKEIKYCKFAGFFMSASSTTTCQPGFSDLLQRKLVKITENTQTRNFWKKKSLYPQYL